MARASGLLCTAFVLAGCGGEETRGVALAPVPLPAGACPGSSAVRQVVVKVLGDFPPTEDTAMASPISGMATSRTIPTGTRVLTVEGLGDRGELVAMGRSAELTLAGGDAPAARRVPILYAAPRAGCPTMTPVGGPRAQHTATLLEGGGVLIAGGITLINNEERLATESELYQPAEARFVRGPDLYRRDPLIGHSATRLSDGRVLVFGGEKAAYQLVAADGLSAEPPSFLAGSEQRAYHGAVALPGGRALLLGGCREVDQSHACRAGTALDTTVRFDPATGALEAGPRLLVARIEPEVVLRADGLLVVAGGHDDAGAPLDSAELVDPSAASATALPGAGAGRLVAALGGGVLSVGGPRGTARREATLRSLGAPALALGELGEARGGHAVVALEDGSVLVSGGLDAAAAARPEVAELELWRPGGGRFEPLRATMSHRREHTATRLSDGSVLLVGGRDPTPGAGARVRADAEVLVLTLASPYMNLPPLSFGATPPELAVARPPADVRSGPARLHLAAGDAAWLAGPSYAEVTLSARLQASGRVALLLARSDEAHWVRVELEAGQPVLLTRHAPGAADSTLCTGRVAPALDGPPLELTVQHRGGNLRVTAGSELLSCRATLGRGGVGAEALTGSMDLTQLGADR
ncbi:MAG: hypothetical protein IT370_33005 [Deltaproteobacteria bacterium]|nr:hypothetical protein [Deltaproteobacteria bacterium]